ncbi:hypothetical protein TWF970_000812 [Orbilia oligospora]|uniref:Uncharacterized protein n=1 Tax=Orbilia oligospora TaxID=2813651 RepID=A0A7C8RI85_ORBOL|nr:hypothetical protein TWF970_000812 [Orbilia oligospora]
MSVENPKPVDPNPTVDAEEREAEAQEALANQELVTWIPYISTKAPESRQILYTLAKKNNNNAPAVIDHPYYIVMRGSDLDYFTEKNYFERPIEFQSAGIYFVSMSEVASCSGQLLIGSNKVTGTKDQVTGKFTNATMLEIFDIEGNYIKITVGFTRAVGYKKFAELAAQTWYGFTSEANYTEAKKNHPDIDTKTNSIIFGPNAGFKPVLELNEKQKADNDENSRALADYFKTDLINRKYKAAFYYNDVGTGADIRPASRFTWFKRATVKSRYPNAETLAKEKGLYVRLNMEDFKISTLDVGFGATNPSRCYIEKEHFKSVWANTTFGGREIVGEPRKRPAPDEETEDPNKPKASKPGESTDVGGSSTDHEKEKEKENEMEEEGGKEEKKGKEEEKGKGKTDEAIKPGARRSWATEIGDDEGYVSSVVPQIYFRDEAGKVWAKRTSDSQKVSNFMHYYERGTTRPDYGSGRFPRAIDMKKITIWIHPLIKDEERYGGTAEKPREKLANIFEKARSTSMSTTYKFLPADEGVDKNTYTWLSRSCFGDYDTYIENTVLTEYLTKEVTDERQVPKDIDADILKKLEKDHAKGIAALAAFNKITGKDEYTDYTAPAPTRITAAKIDAAYGTRASALNQGAVMEGISASDVANALSWSDMRATPINGWDKERFSKAEWLHRVGYAYGGLTDDDPTTSQKKYNLIFGSSETNSIMTRYEDVYRNAIIRERTLSQQLQLIYDKASMANPAAQFVNATLATKLTDKGAKLRLEGKSYIREKIAVPKAKLTSEPKAWTDISKRYPWLCSGLEYDFELDKPSLMFKVARKWNTDFFPFDRLFFTRLEGIVDDAICLKLWELAILDAKTTIDRKNGEVGSRVMVILPQKKEKKIKDVEMGEKEDEMNSE